MISGLKKTKVVDMPSFVYRNKGVLLDAFRFNQAEAAVRKKSIVRKSIRLAGRIFYRAIVLIIFGFYSLITTINHNMKHSGKRPHANSRLDCMWPQTGNPGGDSLFPPGKHLVEQTASSV